jgi:hypothetical protein
MTMTYGAVLGERNISVPEHLEADAEVPVLRSLQRQGDLAVIPRTISVRHSWKVEAIPPEGIAVVRGENGGHTHHLAAYDGVCLWAGNPQVTAADPVLGELEVPAGAVAYLSHDDEHGANGIAPGHYAIVRQVEETDRRQLVSD